MICRKNVPIEKNTRNSNIDGATISQGANVKANRRKFSKKKIELGNLLEPMSELKWEYNKERTARGRPVLGRTGEPVIIKGFSKKFKGMKRIVLPADQVL